MTRITGKGGEVELDCDWDLIPVAEVCHGSSRLLSVNGYEGDDFIAILHGDAFGRISNADARDAYDAAVEACDEGLPDFTGDFEPIDVIHAACTDGIFIDSGPDDDEVIGTPRFEEVFGGTGADQISGGGGSDSLHGWTGNDFIRRGSGSAVESCVAVGGDGDDRIKGSDGGDVLDGGADDDFIEGGLGDDLVYGSGGNDHLSGDEGIDVLEGGEDDDIMSGGFDNPAAGPGVDDYANGGEGEDLCICRIPGSDPGPGTGPGWFHEPPDSPSDCESPATGCDDADYIQGDPWTEWVLRTDVAYLTDGDRLPFGTLITNDVWTTGSAAELVDDRMAGASILMQTEGRLPLAGRFCDGPGCPDTDGLVFFYPDSGMWVFDHDVDGTADNFVYSFPDTNDGVNDLGNALVRPFAGNLDNDPDGLTDIGYFDPTTGFVYVDTDLDGEADILYRFEDLGPGDLPVVGRFLDPDEEILGFFSSRTSQWFATVDTRHVVELPSLSGVVPPSSMPDGAVPLSLDWGEDPRSDPLVYYRESDDWGSWQTVDATYYRQIRWHGGHSRTFPVTGDFDGDGRRDDVGLVDPATGWFVTRPDLFSVAQPEGWVDRADPILISARQSPDPLHTRRVQSYWTCGPQSLEMVFRHLGMTDESLGRVALPRDLTNPAAPITTFTTWNPAGPTANLVDIGYVNSAEHIVWDALAWYYFWHQALPAQYPWPLDGAGTYLVAGMPQRLENDSMVPPPTDRIDCTWVREDYACGSCDPSNPPPTFGNMQPWVLNSPGVGTDTDWNEGFDSFRGLTGVANRAANRAVMALDAWALDGAVPGDDFDSLEHYAAVVAGFVDHGIPLVVGVNRGGHFNTIVGYWDRGDEGFWVYTAEPLDGVGGGWKVPWTNQPIRWNLFPLTEAVNQAGLLQGPMIFGYWSEGCAPNGWAQHIDSSFVTDTLCGH